MAKSSSDGLQTLVKTVASNTADCHLLAMSSLPGHRERFTQRLSDLYTGSSQDILSDFLSWCGKHHSSDDALISALDTRKQLQNKRAMLHNQLVRSLWLKPDADRLRNFVANIPHHYVHKLRKAYPPLGYFACESPEIAQLWGSYLKRRKLPDPRLKRRLLKMVDITKLQHDVKPDENGIFYDAGEMVAYVVRDFCAESGVVEWVDGVVQQCVDVKRSVRLEDPGKICLVGYSAGSRSEVMLGWSRNLTKKLSAQAVAALDYKTSSAFALFWNMVKTHVPPEVITDITEFLHRLSIYRMDSNQQLPGAKDIYTVEVDGIPVEFHGVELAPPMGMTSVNYCRAIHHEPQPHKYALAWTTARSGGSDAGGHFYISEYGIRIQAAPNTLVIWQPRKKHGTSLQLVNPYDRHPTFRQTGLSIATSARAGKAWEAHMDEELFALGDGFESECYSD